MDKVKIFQKLPGPIKSLIASYRGYQLKSLRTINRAQYLQEISARDTWSKEEIYAFQKQKCRDILDHAKKNVPYYRQVWEAIHAKDPSIDHLELNNWPILEKDAIRNNPDAFIADGFDKKDLTHIQTSGTSGKPMSIYFDSFTISYWYAMYEHRIRNWNHVSEDDRWANIGGQLICDVNRNKPPFWTWNSVMRQLYLSSYHITPENTKHYLNAFKKYKIKYLLGYVSSLYNLANEALKNGLEIPKFSVIITIAEPLYEHQKIVIEKAFQCKAIQTYSSSELIFGSNENEEGLMYIWPEAGMVEVVDSDNTIHSTGTGELLTTGFLNKAMPLIRYRLGDTVKINKNKTGLLNYDTFDEIIGRTDDMIVTTEGKLVGRLDPIFKADLNIKESQIIQEDYNRFTINVVKDKHFSEKDTASIESRLKDRVGNNVQVNFEYLDTIPRGANGKFKAVISKVKRS